MMSGVQPVTENLVSPLTRCVTLGKLPNFSELRADPLFNGNPVYIV